MSNAVYDIITERITGLLEEGIIPWRRPWRGGGGPENHVSGYQYHGINVMYLNAVAEHKGYRHNQWVTYHQATKAGGHVRKGEMGYPVVFWKVVEKKARQSTDERDKETYPVLRYYTVFNLDQCEGLEYREPLELPTPHFRPAKQAEAIIVGMPGPPTIEHGGFGASYHPLTDTVRLPDRRRFYASHGYYHTAFHELVHATGHPARLDRFGEGLSPALFGSASYSREELIAEMGAAFLCGIAGIEPCTLRNAAGYIQGWLRKLRADRRLIVTASSKAQQAADHVLGKKR